MWAVNGVSPGSMPGATAATPQAIWSPALSRPIPRSARLLAIPLADDPIVTNGTTTFVTNVLPAPPAGTGAVGSLTINITPGNLAGTGWKFFGETDWRASGSTAANLLPDTYLVAFEPVSGYATPASLAVVVTNGMSVQETGIYAAAPAVPNGVDTPSSLSTANILNYSLPYGFPASCKPTPALAAAQPSRIISCSLRRTWCSTTTRSPLSPTPGGRSRSRPASINPNRWRRGDGKCSPVTRPNAPTIWPSRLSTRPIQPAVPRSGRRRALFPDGFRPNRLCRLHLLGCRSQPLSSPAPVQNTGGLSGGWLDVRQVVLRPA